MSPIDWKILHLLESICWLASQPWWDKLNKVKFVPQLISGAYISVVARIDFRFGVKVMLKLSILCIEAVRVINNVVRDSKARKKGIICFDHLNGFTIQITVLLVTTITSKKGSILRLGLIISQMGKTAKFYILHHCSVKMKKLGALFRLRSSFLQLGHFLLPFRFDENPKAISVEISHLFVLQTQNCVLTILRLNWTIKMRLLFDSMVLCQRWELCEPLKIVRNANAASVQSLADILTKTIFICVLLTLIES